MLIPSIDIVEGEAVQLVGGKELKINGGDPFAWIERFAPVGEVAIVDIDAALGNGNNRELIVELCKRARCRVGGGIRTLADAQFWLESGAEKIVIGTAASPEFLGKLPRDRVVVALDCKYDEVVVKGWTESSGANVFDRLRELRPYVDAFLVTIVEKEGRLTGLDIDQATRLKEAAGDAEFTLAGGIATPTEVATLDGLQIDAQVGMALYQGDFTEADCLWAIANPNEQGLVPTVVCDDRGVALGLVYSSKESIAASLETGKGTYQSRRRGLWVKGETSGATQKVLRVDLDCDRDAFRFVVEQSGSGFCHKAQRDCWGTSVDALADLERTISRRATAGDGKSYTKNLLDDDVLLASKILEEADELVEPGADVVWEAADLIYFTLVRLQASGFTLRDVERELSRRARVPKRKVLGVEKTIGELIPTTRTVCEDNVGEDKVVRRSAAYMVDDVRKSGEPALRRWSEKYGDLNEGENWFYDRNEMEARAEVPDATKQLLKRTYDRIFTFAKAQREAIGEVSFGIDAATVGHDIKPVSAAGCYAPGGLYPLPSSVLMTVATAKAAGVERVIVASPKPTPETFAAALIAGADALIAVGGAQAIGALAFGIEDVFDRVDVIVGPGNKYVTAAKKYVVGSVGIDMLAGPSELVVVADSTADSKIVAADLIAQAEHDPDARPILVTFDESIATSVRSEIELQLSDLATAETATKSLVDNGRTFVVADRDEAVAICDALAPEHLQVLVDDAERFARRLSNYGGLFIGTGAAEVYGDYGLGPNHVLPTSGTARFSSGLSVYDFLRTPTFIKGTTSDSVRSDVERFARLERLQGHARAARLRGDTV